MTGPKIATLPKPNKHATFEVTLSERDLEIIRLLLDGMQRKEVADRMNLSLSRMKQLISSIYARMGVHTTIELTRLAIRHGIISAVLLLAVLLPANAQLSEVLRPIVVDHNSVALFAQIPAEYLTRARNIRELHVDRSVGVIFHTSLECLQYASTAVAPTSCKRWGTALPPETWSQAYPIPNWKIGSWPGQSQPNEISCPVGGNNGYWDGYQKCFLEHLGNVIANYDAAGFQIDYLAAETGKNVNNYFNNQPGNFDIFDYAAMEVTIAPKRLIYRTASLAHGTWAAADATSFNQNMRSFMTGSPRALFDFASIESHLPNGTECRNSQMYPVICNEYTAELNGGHPGGNGFDVGKIRLAKAYWVFMARLAGWVPDGSEPPPPPPPPPPSDTQPPTLSPLVCSATPNWVCTTSYADNVKVDRITNAVTACDAANNCTTVSETVTLP